MGGKTAFTLVLFAASLGAHGVNRVDDQVQHDLLQLDRIGKNRADIRGQIGLQAHAVGPHLRRAQSEDGAGDIVDVESDALRFFFIITG